VDEGNASRILTTRKSSAKITISTGVAFAEWRRRRSSARHRLQYLFERHNPRSSADAALVIVDGVAGVEVQTEKVWSSPTSSTCLAPSSSISSIASVLRSTALSPASKTSSAAWLFRPAPIGAKRNSKAWSTPSA